MLHKSMISLVILAAVIVSCSSEPEAKKSLSIELSGVRYLELATLNEIPAAIPLLAPTTGKIEIVHKNKIYKKNQVVARLNNSNSFNKYATKFEAFKTALSNCLDNFPNELNSVKPKWQKFFDNLNIQQTPPALPEFTYKEVSEHLTTYHVQDAYKSWLKAYLAMEDFFIESPEAGFIIRWKIKKNDRVIRGDTIALFYPKNLELNYTINSTSVEREHCVEDAFKSAGISLRTNKIGMNRITCKIELANAEQQAKIPLDFPISKAHYRFIIPKKHVVKKTVTFYTDKELKSLVSMPLQSINGNDVILYKDSLIYLKN